MSERKRRGKRRSVKAAGSGKRSAKRSARGKPFEKGNLYRWQTGQSGNPAGSSRKQMLSTAYRAVLSHPMPPNLREHIAQMIEDGAPVAEIIAWAMASGAIKGNTPSAVELRKATEGDKLKAALVDDIDSGESGVLQSILQMGDEELSRFLVNLEAALRQ